MLLLGLPALLWGAFDYPPSAINAVLDEAWQQGRFDEIPAVIDQRLAEYPYDVTTLYNAYIYALLYVDDDQAKAQAYLDRLQAIESEVLESIVDADEREQLQVALAQYSPLVWNNIPPDKLAEARESAGTMTRGDKFPNMAFISRMYAKMMARHHTEIAAVLRSDYLAHQQRKVESIKQFGVETLIADCDGLGQGGEREIPRDQWPESLKSLNPVRVFEIDDGLVIWFARLASTYDGVKLHRGEYRAEDAFHQNLTDFGDGVVWFNTRL